jgi:hypothetical protein
VIHRARSTSFGVSHGAFGHAVFAPAVKEEADGVRMTSNSDAFGSLAALFTTPSAGAGASSEQSSPAVGTVTTLLVCNVPVMAGLWVSQFAHEVGRAHGATALVRFEREDVTVELLHADGRQVPPSAPDALSAWLPKAATGFRRWLLCVPAEAPPSDVLAAGNDLVVLTGADEAAVTGAYLRLKQIVDEGVEAGIPLQRVGLVVVGSMPEQAAQASARLGDAARSFLGLDVELVACLPRIERIDSSARGTYARASCPQIAAFSADLRAARSRASLRLHDDHGMEAVSLIDAVAAPSAAPSHAGLAPAAVPAVGVLGSVERLVIPPVSRDVSVQRAVTNPAVQSRTALAARSVTALPAKLVPLLRGLSALGLTCPVAPDVELALDDQRRLHIVGRSGQLEQLRAAHAWAVTHFELLGLAFPELRDGFEVRERMLVGDARDAMSAQGSDCLIEVLVVADTPAGPVNVLVPLYDPSKGA